MRVLHVAGGEMYGGIERMLATLAATRSDVIAQHFAVSPAGRLWGELRAAGSRPLALPPARASRPLSILSARREFARALVDLQPDAAIFHGSWTHAMFAATARKHGAEIAFWQHAPIAQPRWPDRWAAWTAPDVVIANSRFTAAEPVFRGAAAHVIHCPVPMPPPLAAEERRAGRAALGAGDRDTVILMAARLEAWKGHSVLIEAARALGIGKLKVWIAGGVQRACERPYCEQLERQIADAGLRTSVAMLGERDDVRMLTRLADIYCQPNLAPEPFGIAIAEAMRASLPCIVSNTGGATELVDASCGILTAPGNVGAVADAIGALVVDPRRREVMGRAAAFRAARLTDPSRRLAELAAVLDAKPAHAA